MNDVALLLDAKRCSREIAMENGDTLELTKLGSVQLHVIAAGVKKTVTLTDVYMAPQLTCNIVSFEELEQKGLGLVYNDGARSLARRSDGEVAFDVTTKNNVLFVVMATVRPEIEAADVIMTVLEADNTIDLSRDVQVGSLIHFNQRFGHLLYDTIERIARNPESGIELNDRRRLRCVTCMQSKQMKNAQSKKDSGANSPIERVGGVICSDLKGPLMPRDRLGNRYLVNFVDHKSNYCRVFLAKSKDQAAKNFNDVFRATFWVQDSRVAY